MPKKLPNEYTDEIGSAVNWGLDGTIDQWEENQALRFPDNIKVYDIMRSTDSQIVANNQAEQLFILGTPRKIAGDKVRPEVKAAVEAQLGLQVDQEGRKTIPKSGFNFDEFLKEALTYRDFGFALFERVYDDIRLTEADENNFGLTAIADLNRLSFRPQRSIADPPKVARNGDLISYAQWVQEDVGQGFSRWEKKDLPASQLVVFVNEKEGGNWLGRSAHRAYWVNWTYKVKLMQIDAIANERGAMGIPAGEYTDDVDKAAVLDAVSNIRAGHNSAIVYPVGSNVRILGIEGQTKDVWPSIKAHNEEIGRAALAMFLNLGHDRGSQSLGETFFELFCKARNATLRQFEEIITEQVIRHFVALNYGPNEPYPAIMFDDITPNATPTPEQLSALVAAGIITPDRELEADQRRVFGFPNLEDSEPRKNDALKSMLDVQSEPDQPSNVTPINKQPTVVDDDGNELKAASAMESVRMKELMSRVNELKSRIAIRQAESA